MQSSKKQLSGFEAILKQQFATFKNELEHRKPTKYLTRAEVCTMISISKTTLWRRTNDGTIPSYSIGGRVLYKASEVNNSIIKLKK